MNPGPSLVQHYADVLRRRKWVLLVPLVVLPVLAFGYSLTRPSVYSAHAQVLVQAPSLPEALAGLPAEDLSDRTLATQAA